MADPISAGLIVGVAALGSVMKGIQGFQQGKAEQQTAEYNAQLQQQAAASASQSAAANEAASLRKGALELGGQAAAFGQANVGTGPTVQGLERQSATSARLDALNQWYGGRLEATNALNQQRLFSYQSKVAAQNARMSLISGGIGAGTSLLLGGAGAYQGGPGGRAAGASSYLGGTSIV